VTGTASLSGLIRDPYYMEVIRQAHATVRSGLRVLAAKQLPT